MKKSVLVVLIIVSIGLAFSQNYGTEEVEWLNPKIYKTKTFTFKTDSVLFVLNNCKVFEIRTISGVTGYFVEGDGNITISTKKLNEKCTAAMFRFNPLELDSLVSTDGLKDLKDDAFVNSSMTVLISTFRHCYHSGMSAIIPDPGFYAVNFFSTKIGEVLVSKDKKEMIYYNFTLNTKL